MKRSEMIQIMIDESMKFQGEKMEGAFFINFFDAILSAQEDAGLNYNWEDEDEEETNDQQSGS